MKRIGWLTGILLILIVLSVTLSQPAWAGVLDRRGHEINLGFQYLDPKDAGSSLDFSGTWLLILADGYLEIGPEGAYTRLDLGGPFGVVDGYTIGPRIEVNLTPQEPVTPYASFSVFYIGGDVGDNTNGGISGGGG